MDHRLADDRTCLALGAFLAYAPSGSPEKLAALQLSAYINNRNYLGRPVTPEMASDALKRIPCYLRAKIAICQ